MPDCLHYQSPPPAITMRLMWALGFKTASGVRGAVEGAGTEHYFYERDDAPVPFDSAARSYKGLTDILAALPAN